MTNVMTPETSEKGLRICLDSYVDSDYVEVVPVCLEYLNSHKCFFFWVKIIIIRCLILTYYSFCSVGNDFAFHVNEEQM